MDTARRVLFAALAFACGTVAAKDGATGTVTIDGKSWPVADAIALMDGEDLQIVFAQAKWDRAEWADDGEFGTFDLFEFAGDAEAQQLNVDIDEESGKYGGHNIRYSGSSSSGGYSSDHEASVVLTTRTAERVAGTVKMAGEDIASDVAFDLPITRTGPLARAGTPLPADGGVPG